MLEKMKDAMLSMTRQCWEQGIAGQAIMERDEYDCLRIMVHDMVTRQSIDGRLCNIENTPAVTDSSFCIPSVMMIGRMDQCEDYTEAAHKNIYFLMHQAERNADGVLFHIKGTQEIWADSAGFLPYALAMSGHSKEAIEQMQGLLNRLYDAKSGLYFHIWDEQNGTYKRKVRWGIGNGWILTGIQRLLPELPKEYETDKKRLQEEWNRLLDAMLSYQTKNHLFYDIMDDEDSFEESECSTMIAYAIFRGITENLLPEAYVITGEEIRTALWTKVREDGLIMQSAGSPNFISPGTSVESQAHFLMMEAAYAHLKK